jgi:endogenous inhibitor of DNA gyrase (YacG/DUF329 family)
MPPRSCPQCQSAVEWEGNPHRPFCSERCRLVDLEGWLGERYAIPGEPDDVDELGEGDDAGDVRRDDAGAARRDAPPSGGRRRVSS